MSVLENKKVKKTILVVAIIITVVIASVAITYIVKIFNWINEPVENGLDIHSDNDFIELNFPGTGTENDPYIIANYTFDEEFIGISIINTTKHFVVTNCTITGFNVGIELVNVAFGTALIKNNNITEGWWPEVGAYYGIRLESSNGTVIHNNTISSIGLAGIQIENSESCIVTDNKISQMLDGLEVISSSQLLVTNNSFTDNSFHGVVLDSDSFSNLIFLNSFIADDVSDSQGSDRGTSNYWYNSTAMIGNYWSDWSESGNYTIAGSAGAVDMYPLSSPPV